MANIGGLSVKDKKEHDKIAADIRVANLGYGTAVDEFNAEQRDAWEELSAAVAAYNDRTRVAAEALRAAREIVSDTFRRGREFAENIASEIAADAEIRSDKWRHTRRCAAVEALAETWIQRGAELCLDPLASSDAIEIEESDGAAEIDGDCIEEFANLPSTPDSEPE